MAQQPPRFRRPGTKRQAWARPVCRPDLRKRGRAGQRDRAQVLAEEPFCRACLKNGEEVATDIIDHIKPLSEGGSDLRSNKQGLCKPCHDEKSKAERAEARRPRHA